MPLFQCCDGCPIPVQVGWLRTDLHHFERQADSLRLGTQWYVVHSASARGSLCRIRRLESRQSATFCGLRHAGPAALVPCREPVYYLIGASPPTCRRMHSIGCALNSGPPAGANNTSRQTSALSRCCSNSSPRPASPPAAFSRCSAKQLSLPPVKQHATRFMTVQIGAQ